MAITYPLTMPAAPGYAQLAWIQRTVVSSTRSTFNGVMQTYVHPGQWFEALITLPLMEPATAKPWIAFFNSLNGLEGTFYLTPSPIEATNASAKGTPLVNGAAQTGNTLITDGWTAGQTALMSAGDWISIGNRLHLLREDVDTDGGGNATIEIFPRIATAPADDAALEVTSPQGIFKLASVPEITWNRSRLLDSIQFVAIEDV